MADMLQELRVMQTSAQLTAGFLLTLPFQQAFANLSTNQERFYLFLVMLAALVTALVLAPVAIHRRLSGQQVKHRVVSAGHVLMLLALALAGRPRRRDRHVHLRRADRPDRGRGRGRRAGAGPGGAAPGAAEGTRQQVRLTLVSARGAAGTRARCVRGRRHAHVRDPRPRGEPLEVPLHADPDPAATTHRRPTGKLLADMRQSSRDARGQPVRGVDRQRHGARRSRRRR